MTIERARVILGVLTSHHFYEMGLQETPPAQIDFTLREACEARDMVEASPPEKIPGGTRMPVSIADRGIAIVFALTQYDLRPGEANDVLIHDRKKALVLADLARCGGKDEE